MKIKFIQVVAMLAILTLLSQQVSFALPNYHALRPMAAQERGTGLSSDLKTSLEFRAFTKENIWDVFEKHAQRLRQENTRLGSEVFPKEELENGISAVRAHAEKVAQEAQEILSILIKDEGVGPNKIDPEVLRCAALAHDIGKLENLEALQVLVLSTKNKREHPAMLDDREREIIRRHSERSVAILEESGIAVPDEVREAILRIHNLSEGPPPGIFTQILVVADHIAALLEGRTYRDGKSLPSIAVGIIMRAEFQKRHIGQSVFEAAGSRIDELILQAERANPAAFPEPKPALHLTQI